MVPGTETRRVAATPSEIALIAFLVFALHYYSYVYFFPWQQGASGAPAWVMALNDVAYLAFVGALVVFIRPSISHWLRWPANLFIPLLGLMILTSAMHAFHTNPPWGHGWQSLKNMAIYIPVFMLVLDMKEAERKRITQWFFGLLVFAAVTQPLISIGAGYFDIFLWSDSRHAGLMGNPTMFAMTLVLALSVILAYSHRLSVVQLVVGLTIVALITYGILRANTTAHFAIMVLLVLYAAALRFRKWRVISAIAAVVLIVFTMNADHFHSTTYSFYSIVNFFWQDSDPSEEYVSISVSYRWRDATLSLSVLTSSPTDALLGSFSAEHFVPMDGQFWVLLYNHGALTLIAFAIPALFLYGSSLLRCLRHPEDDAAFALHLMLVVFGVTFITGRILMYFPFNFIFFLIAALLLGMQMIDRSLRHQRPA